MAQSKKEIIDKQDLIKIKNFCSTKDNVKRIKRHATDWEKVLMKQKDIQFQKKKRKKTVTTTGKDEETFGKVS